MRSGFIGAVVFCALAGCTPLSTPYTEEGLGGGVAATAVSADVYRVTAYGNGATTPAQIQDYVLLKSAETTKEKGAAYFSVVEDRDTSRTLFLNGQQMDRPAREMLIKIGNDNAPGAINAAETISTISPRVKRDLKLHN